MLAGLRVAFVAFEPLPNHKGSGTRIAQVTEALRERGSEVTVLGLPGRGEAAMPGITLRALRVAEDNYLRRALGFRDAVARELQSLRPDVIHFRGPFEGQAALSVARQISARTVFEVNGLPSVELRYHHPRVAGAADFEGKLRELEREVLRGADHLVTQSETTARFLAGRRGDPPHRSGTIAVVRNGADPYAEPPPPPDGLTNILYIGSLAPWQGLPELLLAMRRVRRAGLAVTLSIIGSARKRWRRQLARWSRRLRIEDAVELIEPMARANLRAHIARADLCVAPLRRDIRNEVQGCNPIKLYEYRAAARPIISTDLSCVREIITHEVDGWLVRPSHPKALAEGVIKLAEDTALLRRIGEAAEHRFRACDSWVHRRAEVGACYARWLRASA